MKVLDKLCFLFVVLLSIVVQSTSIDFYSRKGNSALERTSYDDDTNRYNYDNVDDDGYSQPSTYRRNRYSPQGQTLNNYRSRSRWPSSYEDANDWSRYGYGHNNPSFPGPISPADADFENGAFSNNGPSCYSLLDPIYPLFSDICGAVPQARYSLPNTFGHFERWQIAQVLTAILGPTASSSPPCTRSLRLLLCPLLFPPCATRYETPPVLPCQPFCRVVKNQCASPSLDLLPCDILPPASDLCPINPTPYNSLISPFGSQFPFNGISPPIGFPQSPFPSISAQSGPPRLDIPAFPFPSLFSPSGFPSQFSPSMPPPGVPSSALSSLLSSSGPPPFAHLSFLSSPGASAMSPFSSPSNFASSPGASAMSPFSSPSSFASSPYSQLLNPESYMADSLPPILVDFPPIGYPQDYRRPASRYFPRTRSATETV